MPEKDIVAAIKKYLASLGSDVFFWKEWGGPYGTSGVPDIICCCKGRFLGLEVKQPKGRLTELQKRAIEKINAAGGIACRVESVEDVKCVIEQADREVLPIQKNSTQGAARRPRIPLVYICSPYRGDIETNVHHARAYCSLAASQGCIPFAPHLLFMQFLDDNCTDERMLGMYMGAEMLRLCDELWTFGEPSEGMTAEIELARRIGIPVRRHDMKGQVIDDE
ncbi:MAG: VRR-NUC domain-containing protein [Clostridia bacterium]|nr:VRR-NUC domain-containing protein [Clostridia bacterium]